MMWAATPATGVALLVSAEDHVRFLLVSGGCLMTRIRWLPNELVNGSKTGDVPVVKHTNCVCSTAFML